MQDGRLYRLSDIVSLLLGRGNSCFVLCTARSRAALTEGASVRCWERASELVPAWRGRTLIETPARFARWLPEEHNALQDASDCVAREAHV